MRAMLFCTINDFPAYRNMCGYSVKGPHACPICEEDTSYIQLKHGRKTLYTRYRRFLKAHHPYRWLKKARNCANNIDWWVGLSAGSTPKYYIWKDPKEG